MVVVEVEAIAEEDSVEGAAEGVEGVVAVAAGVENPRNGFP